MHYVVVVDPSRSCFVPEPLTQLDVYSAVNSKRGRYLILIYLFADAPYPPIFSIDCLFRFLTGTRTHMLLLRSHS